MTSDDEDEALTYHSWYYQKNKERIKEHQRQYYQRNKEKIKEDQRRRKKQNKEVLKEYYLQYRDQNKEKRLLQRARQRAKNKNIPFNIGVEDVFIPEVCPILGVKLEVASGGAPAAGSPSLDRIVPEKGYTKGNVQVISYRANLIKTNATADEIMAVAKYMKEHENDV